ncbi:MAG: MCE family protein, partial [Magnetococcales bacterium]|nr:MCE family protein [Magnetococcales bacterium]
MDPLPTHESSSLPTAMVTKERPLPLVWLLPLVVALVALWLVVSTYWNHGTTVTITFESANGVVAGKTKVKYKGVVIGDVEEVRLSPTLSHVVVETLLDKSITPYLKGNTRFWVVQPQLSMSGVSGLNTLVSGVYLEMEPGNEGPPTFAFRGLNVPPLLRVEAAGQEFVLTTSGLGSLTSGSPVSYHGIKVGEVLGYRLAEDQQSLRIHLFVRDPYHRLVTASSRFWNASGFSVNVTPAGVNVKS